MNSSDIKWKMQQHRELVNYGIRHSFLRDLLSKSARTTSLEMWRELPMMVAKSMGCEFTTSTPSSSLNEIFVEKIYNVEGFVPSPKDTICDVGASYGDSSIWWSKVFGARVLAFEPLKDIYKILQSNIILNNVAVKSFNIALGNGDPIRSRKERDMLAKSEMPDSNITETTKLDDLRIESLDILKIDVEGFELEVLKGAKDTIIRHGPKIIIETHSKNLRKICHEFLSSLGYSLKFEGRTIISKNPGMDRITNLFYLRGSSINNF